METNIVLQQIGKRQKDRGREKGEQKGKRGAMICTNCYKKDYVTTQISKEVVIDGRPVVIDGIECEKCPNCGDVVFTHQQSLALDKKRVNAEFGSKPILTASQLRLLRSILGLSLEDICDILHIGKNTYGRWERGEVSITPSMNLLVHNLIDRFPAAKVNLFDAEIECAIRKAKDHYMNETISLGEYIRRIESSFNILPQTICRQIDTNIEYLYSIRNNEVHPERIPIEVSANIVKFFQLPFDIFRQMLENSLSVYSLRDKVSFIHTRTASHGRDGKSKSNSINKVLEQYVYQDKNMLSKHAINQDYLDKVNECIRKMESGK